MFKKLFLLLFVAVAFTACNNAPTNEGDKVTAEAEETQNATEVLTVDQLLVNIGDLVGKSVSVTGDVDHVCKHGGTKMVILGDTADIHIKASDESGNFRADEVMDHRVVVNGIVDEFRVDEDYIAKKEGELEEMIANGGDKEEKVEAEEHEEKGMFPDNDSKHKKQIAGMEKQIEGLKKMLEEARAEGKDHVSFYSVKANNYEVVEGVEVKSEAKAFDDSAAEVAEETESAKEESTEVK